ncbi:MAG: NifU N-terminal domain-containing protein [Tepidisphaeraceae bacterium]
MPFRVTDAHPTPNPNALKYSLDGPISDKPISFFNAEAGRDHPIAGKLFEIDGVASVLLLNDFVTVNKTPAAKWKDITPAVKKVLKGL